MEEHVISVVMPVRNEEATVAAAIASIADQQVEARLEIVVAEGGSTDGTRAILDDLATRNPTMRIVDNPGGATATGLNAAIAASTGSYIVRVDGHAELPAGYIARAIATLERTGAGNVGGIQRATGEAPMQRAIAAGMTTPMGVGDARFHRGGAEGPVDTVYLGVFRRSVLEEVGTYDESLVRNQDYELNTRIRTAGHEVYFDPGLEVAYRPRKSLRSLASQYFQYGRWKRVVTGRDPASIRWRQVVPPVFVIALVASLALLAFGIGAGLFVPLVYAAAVLGTAFVEAVRRRDAALILLALVLPTMHLAWGSGFLIGRPDRPARNVGTIG